ncbi:deoxycytidyl transferase, partial [Desmophyllum pertusum]
MCTRVAKPDGCYYLGPADDINKFMGPQKREFGPKTGLVLYQYCRGIDDRALRTERERKSVSAEINYGIRFTKESEMELFINELAEEVQKKTSGTRHEGQVHTLKACLGEAVSLSEVKKVISDWTEAYE